MKPAEFLARQPRSAWIAAAVVLLTVGWFLYVPPAMDLQRLSRQWDELKLKQGETRRLLDRYYREKIGLIPEEGRLPGLLEILQEKARRHHLEVSAVSPGTIPDHAAGAPAFCPLELQLEGEYRELGGFLGECRDSARLGWISVRRIRIGREEGILPRLRAQVSMEIALQ